jgi:Sulfotransferase family
MIETLCMMGGHYKLGVMSPSPDWSRREDAIAARLAAADRAAQRDRMLAELAGYAGDVVAAARRNAAADPTQELAARYASWLVRPVFICGHHRSGTTLMQELLDAHPELLVLPSEGTFFASFGYAARATPAARDVDRFITEWVCRLIDPNQEPHFKLGRSNDVSNPYLGFASRLLAWHRSLQRQLPELAPFALLLALVAAFKDSAAADSVPRMWVEKTPLNESHVARFAAFREALFIHVVRNPNDALASLLETYRTSGVAVPDGAAHACELGRSFRLATENARRLPRRYLVVRYEDLADRPAEEMERVRAFLGISPSASLAVPTVVGRAVRPNSAFDRGEAGVVRAARRAAELSAADARLVGALAGAEAAAFGYQLAPVSGWVRAVLRLRQLPTDFLRRARPCLRRISFAAWPMK